MKRNSQMIMEKVIEVKLIGNDSKIYIAGRFIN